MTDPSLTYIRVTMEQAMKDIDRADGMLRKGDPSESTVTAILWRLDFVRHACRRVIEEVAPEIDERAEVPTDEEVAA